MKGFLLKFTILFFFICLIPVSFRFLGLPYLYEKVFYNEVRKEVANIQNLLSYPGFFELSKDEFILSTYFKIDYLLDNEKAHFKKDQKLIFSFKNSNFIAGPTVRYVNSSEDRLKYYYSMEGWKDYFRIKGFFTKDVMLFLKYYFGIPFFFTEELNIVWDSFVKGKAFSYSSIYLDLEKDKLNDPSLKVDPRVFYYSFSLFDLLEENSVPVEIIYYEGECSSGVKNHLADLENRFSNITLVRR